MDELGSGSLVLKKAQGWKVASRSAVLRKLGEAVPKEEQFKSEPPLKRIKTLANILETNNMHTIASTHSLARYRIKMLPSGEWELSPYLWPHLSLCPDRAAPNIATDCFLGQHVLLNVHTDWDLEHDYKNSGNQALKDNRLWKMWVAMTAAHNCTYGSQLSPARFFQIKEAFKIYCDTVNPKTDAWLLYWMPFIIKHLKLESKIDIGSDTAPQDCVVGEWVNSKLRVLFHYISEIKLFTFCPFYFRRILP